MLNNTDSQKRRPAVGYVRGEELTCSPGEGSVMLTTGRRQVPY